MGPHQMDTNACAEVVPVDVISTPPTAPEVPAAILRGTARGLEVVIDGGASIEAVTTAVMDRLDEAPGFFRGSDVRIRVEDGPLPVGCLARLDEIAATFELRIVEVTAATRTKPDDPAKEDLAPAADAVPEPNLAAGSVPSLAFEDEAPTNTNANDVIAEAVALPPEPATVGEPAPPLQLATTPESEPAPIAGTRTVVGPVRSGVILEHVGNLIIFGDVNPGAEVRASGNIVVLGRLRGTAHAGIGQDIGFIMALRRGPKQLRISRKVARAADSDKGASEPEIAYLTGDHVVVERYLGKLPKNLATSL
jgi:septum site-determining protein MinC